jgi:hypothetical protein
MALGYFHNNYFHANYWHANYWSAGGSEVGDYWQSFYWHPNYWQANYWQKGAGPGDISQTSTPTLGFTAFSHQAGGALNVGANTPTLALTPQNTTAGLFLEVQVTTSSLSLTPQNATIGLTTDVYQLGDIDLRIVPESTFEVTYGVLATAPSLGFSVMSHTIGETGGINVAASIPSLGFTPFVTDSRLDIAVEPLPPSLGFTPQNATAGIGAQVQATQPTLGFSVATHLIVGTPESQGEVTQTAPPTLALAAQNAAAVGRVPPAQSTATVRFLGDASMNVRFQSPRNIKVKFNG